VDLDEAYTVNDLAWSGNFNDEAGTISGIELSFDADLRVGGLLGDDVSADEACILLLVIGAPCIPCSDGVSNCLRLALGSMSGVASEVEVTEVPEPTL
jgi:hypothetical protein